MMSNFAEFDVPEGKNPQPPRINESQREEPVKKASPNGSSGSPKPAMARSFNPRFLLTIVGLAGLYVFAVGVFAKFQPETTLFFAAELHPYMYFGWIGALIGLSLSKSGLTVFSIVSKIAWIAFIVGSLAWGGSLVWGWIQTGEWWTFGL